jgi:hypothetical protein
VSSFVLHRHSGSAIKGATSFSSQKEKFSILNFLPPNHHPKQNLRCVIARVSHARESRPFTMTMTVGLPPAAIGRLQPRSGLSSSIPWPPFNSSITYLLSASHSLAISWNTRERV